jgi:hypothetical protein
MEVIIIGIIIKRPVASMTKLTITSKREKPSSAEGTLHCIALLIFRSIDLPLPGFAFVVSGKKSKKAAVTPTKLCPMGRQIINCLIDT